MFIYTYVYIWRDYACVCLKQGELIRRVTVSRLLNMIRFKPKLFVRKIKTILHLIIKYFSNIIITPV